MKPVRISNTRFIDGIEHRQELPSGYNFYRRVNHGKGYQPQFDNQRMLLSPLYLTSFCIGDALEMNNWYGAEQIIILSASSKTSIGLGYAIESHKDITSIGVTSARNIEMVKSLNLYDKCLTYATCTEIDANIPTVIVDMSGNSNILAQLHQHLGDNMKWTINVGLTHWSNAQPQKGINRARSSFFFAPSHIQKRIKEWGARVFDAKTLAFLQTSFVKTSSWLTFKNIEGLEGLTKIHGAVCEGKVSPSEGLIVHL